MDVASLRFLTVFFPYSHTDSIVGLLWAFRRPSDGTTIVSCSGLADQLLITLVDVTSSGEVVALFFGRLPSLFHIHATLKSAGPRLWSYLFPRYKDMSIRPAYFATLESSQALPLSSNRGFLWGGTGFLKVFRFVDIFDSAACQHNAVSIQLIWDAETHRLSNIPSQPWRWWTTAIAPLTEFSHSSTTNTKPMTPTERLRGTPCNGSNPPSSPLQSESLLLATLQGSILLVVLSVVEEPLVVHRIEKIAIVSGDNGRSLSMPHGLLTFKKVNAKDFPSFLYVTASGTMTLLHFHSGILTASRSSRLRRQDQDVKESLETSLKLTASTVYTKGHHNFIYWASDLLSGTLGPWVIQNFKRSSPIVEYQGSTPLRYSRYIQSPSIPRGT